MSTAGTVYEALLAIGGGRHGHLRRVNATSLIFIPWGGDRIKINGVWYPIPPSGLTISNSGLSASTLYFVYAYWTGSALAAEFSATGHSASTVDANAGTEIKTGDETRSLIGYIRTDASSQFVDTEAQRWVRSWFNRRLDKRGLNYTGATSSTVATSPVVMNSAWILDFLLWANEVATATIFCSAWNNTAGTVGLISLYWDGASRVSGNAVVPWSDSVGNWHNMSYTDSASFSTDGRHQLSPYFWTLGGIFAGVTSGGPQVQLNGRIG